MIVIGLTGSVGMGKSTTAKIFREQGVPIFDSDAAVHRLYKGAAVAPVDAAFPGAARDGVIDREVLGRQVLGDEAAMTRLEAIVHPLVQRERDAFLAQAKIDAAPMVVLDIPLLYETGAEKDVDAVVLASAPEAVQRARVLARPGMTESRFAAIIAKQLPDAEKRKRARFVVETGDGLAAAAAQVRGIIETMENERA